MLNLASRDCMEQFKWIILVGSADDNYIPAYSSLVNYQGEDEKTKEIFKCLQDKMKKAIRCEVKVQYS